MSPALEHRSREFAEKMITAVQNMETTEQSIRDLFFDCYSTAYARGYQTGIAQAPHRKDMGR